jgi:hypothetical protein
MQAVEALPAQHRKQLLHRSATLFADQGGQASLGQILLAGIEHNRSVILHQGTEIVELDRGQAHRAPAAQRVERPVNERRAASRLTMYSAISGSGRTASANPPRATKPGIPQTT